MRLIPWPISFLQLTDEQGNEQTLKVYAAAVLPHVDKPAGTILSVDKKGIQIATKEGVLNLLQLQPAGKKPMSVQASSMVEQIGSRLVRF